MDTVLRLVIWGRVQGVGFRAWTVRRARAQGLRGWVRNRSDGTVETLLIGAGDAVAAMAALCERGPTLAEVSAVERFPAADDGSPGFAERATL